MSRDEFARKFTVTYAKRQSLAEIFALEPGYRGKTVIKDPSTDRRYLRREDIIDYFYDIIIVHRHKYLALFFGAYFEFKEPKTLKWTGTDLVSDKELDGHTIISLQKNDPSKRLIRNLFYLELLDQTRITNTVKSSVSFWQSLLNMYNNLTLEDRFFAPSSIDQFLKPKGSGSKSAEINYNALFYLFQAYQPKASIFNPYAIKWTLDNIIGRTLQETLGRPGQSLFTPVLSWCSYLMAFMHSSSYKTYVGVDVMPSVCEKAEGLARWYRDEQGIRKDVEILCQPSEDLGAPFIRTYADSFDTVLVCPPYFDMEIYPEGPQSTEMYPDYNDWLESYWRQTVETCHQVSRVGGVFALIGNDYQTLDGKNYPLAQDLDGVVRDYYEFVDMYYLQNRTSPLRVNAKDRTERLFIYKKT